MRCVKEDHSAINMTLHYLDNGTVMLNFIYQKELFFLPLGFVLKVMTMIIPTSIFFLFHYFKQVSSGVWFWEQRILTAGQVEGLMTKLENILVSCDVRAVNYNELLLQKLCVLSTLLWPCTLKMWSKRTNQWQVITVSPLVAYSCYKRHIVSIS